MSYKSSKLLSLVLLCGLLATPQTTTPNNDAQKAAGLLFAAGAVLNPAIAVGIATVAIVPIVATSIILFPIAAVTTIVSVIKIGNIFVSRNDYAKNQISKKELIADYSIALTVLTPNKKRLKSQQIDKLTFTAKTAEDTTTLMTEWIETLDDDLCVIAAPSVRLHDGTKYQLRSVRSKPENSESLKAELIDMFYVPRAHSKTYGKRMLLWTLPTAAVWSVIYVIFRAIKKSYSVVLTSLETEPFKYSRRGR